MPDLQEIKDGDSNMSDFQEMKTKMPWKLKFAIQIDK